jgi:peptide/nickel transport system substrate-binding protein
MSELHNPYIAGAPVTEARMFFGREDVFDWIERSLTGRYADHILVIHGQRRVGKTSVLKQLSRRLPDHYVPVFFDLQGRTHTSLDRFLWWLAREITRVLKQDRGLSLSAPEKEAFAQDAEYFENHFLPSLRPSLGDKVLLLTFDEFDNLEDPEIRESLAKPLVDNLRRLQGREGINFIFSIGSSGRKLENMQASYTEFFKTALYKKISFLGRQEAHNLITRPVAGSLEFEPQAVDRIFEMTSGHPYFTQLMCHELFSTCQTTGDRLVSEQDVAAIVDDVVERGTVNLKFVWDEASDLEKWVLAGLAHLVGKPDSRALVEFLRLQKVRFTEASLDSALLRLRGKDVLTDDNRFVIYLLKLWLRKNRPPEQVREELTEVNPIANRYIEIGLEYRDGGEHAKAIGSFSQALQVDPDNVQAQVQIGLVYVDQKDYPQAVAAFVKALAMDMEDVSARTGLCEAHLALGDRSRARGDVRNAVQSYLKVLTFNPEHLEARQRLAEVHTQRAEQALVSGKDEEALGAFAEALKYGPDDDRLARRVAEVRAEKQVRVIAGLQRRANEALAAKEWERAIAAFEEVASLAPEETGVRESLAAARKEQRQFNLKEALSRADAAYAAGKWDEVVASLEAAAGLTPEDTTLQSRLDEARRQMTDANLESKRARARSLARAERWVEAVAAWEDVLAHAPGEKTSIDAEIERLRRARGSSETYAQAQAALAGKDYEKALRHLNELVLQSPGYKDTTRLIGQALEARRSARRAPQRPGRRWGGAAIGGGIALALVIFGVGFLLLVRLLRPSGAAGGPSAGSFRSSDRSALVVAQPDEPSAIDPAWTFEPAGSEVIQNIYETLVFYNREHAGEFVPQIATSWTISDDGRSYTFTIRQGVTFHNGAPLTPSDVVWSFRRGLLQGGLPQYLLTEPLFGTGTYDIAQLISAGLPLLPGPEALSGADPADLSAACETVQAAIVDNGDGTVTFHLAQHWAPFLATIAQPWGSIQQKDWAIQQGAWDGDCGTWQNYYGRDAETTPLRSVANGTGPFQLDHWTPGQEIVLTRFDGYWRTAQTGPAWEGGPTGRASIQRIVIRPVPDAQARLAMLVSGEADIATLPPDVYAQADPQVGERCTYQASTEDFSCTTTSSRASSIRVYTGQPGLARSDAFFTFEIETDDSNPYIGSGQMDGNGIPPDFFSDAHVRRAFNYCFDWESLISGAMAGEGIQHFGPLIPGLPGYDPAAPHYSHDLEQCRAEIEQAWDGQVGQRGFYFQMGYNTGDATRQAVAEILQANFRELDPRYRIDGVGLPFEVFAADMYASRLPIFISTWSENVYDPHNWARSTTVGVPSWQSLPAALWGQYQRLVSAGAAATDPATRAGIYAELNQLDYESIPAIRLAVGTTRHYQQRWIEGWYYNPIYAGTYFYTLVER